MYVHMYVCTHGYMYVCTYLFIYFRHVCLYVCMYVCMYVCVINLSISIKINQTTKINHSFLLRLYCLRQT
jgi:hypothetical protein